MRVQIRYEVVENVGDLSKSTKHRTAPTTRWRTPWIPCGLRPGREKPQAVIISGRSFMCISSGTRAFTTK